VLHSTRLSNAEEPGRGGATAGAFARGSSAPSTASDRFDRDTMMLVQRLSRRPVDIAPDSELMADLGFDSLQVLELVGELEDHFAIAVPLNSLTHIRTVGQIAAEVRRLASGDDRPQP
jgi:acyl carrier protein